jgi:phage tail-like protein
MSCLPDRASTRVLDHHVGWEAERTEGLRQVAGQGLRLTSASPAGCAVDGVWLDGCLPDRSLAPAGDGGWLLVHEGVLTRLDPCGPGDAGFVVIEPCGLADVDLVAIAAGHSGVALLNRDLPGVIVVEPRTLRVRRRLRLRDLWGAPRVVAWVGRSLLVVSDHEAVILALDGRVLRRDRAVVLSTAERAGLVSIDGGAAEPVIAVSAAPGWYQLFRFGCDGVGCVAVDPTRVTCCEQAGSVRGPDGFCVPVGDDVRCFTLGGTPTPGPLTLPRPGLATAGHLLTLPLDGGHEDTNWTRLRIEADRPPGTTVQVRAVSSTAADRTPLEDEWRTVPANASDAQLRVPPGRYLRLRVDLGGQGRHTPVLHRIRVDLDAPGTIDLLPAVYRREPTSTDFTRRFLALFDAELEDADAAIARAPAMLDPGSTTPSGVAERALLTALAGLVGLDVDGSWPADRVRQLIRRPDLLVRRGTPTGLGDVLRLLFDIPVHVEELGASRPWRALGRARLGQVRLYSRATSAVRLGSSALGAARIDAIAAPERSAHSSGAFEAVVHAAGAGLDDDQRAGVVRTVRSFAPAHVDASVRFSADASRLGTTLLVGIDTRIGGSPAVALRRHGAGRSPRLGRAVLTPGRGVAVTVGRRAHVGLDTTVG